MTVPVRSELRKLELSVTVRMSRAKTFPRDYRPGICLTVGRRKINELSSDDGGGGGAALLYSPAVDTRVALHRSLPPPSLPPRGWSVRRHRSAHAQSFTRAGYFGSRVIYCVANFAALSSVNRVRAPVACGSRAARRRPITVASAHE